MTFLGIVACQVGTAFAARTDDGVAARGRRCSATGCCCGASPSSWCSSALIVTVPPLQELFGTAVPTLPSLLLLPAFPVLVWAADAARRRRRLRRADVRAATA